MKKIRSWYVYDFKYEVSKKTESLMLFIAWKMPKWLVKWCAIRLMAHATTGEYSDTIVPELSIIDALRRWDTAR